MSPELLNAIVAVVSALLSAGSVWAATRRNGTAPKPTSPIPLPLPTDPASPAQPVNFPTTGRPGIDLLIRLFLARQAKQAEAQQADDVRAFLAELDSLQAAQRAGK